MPADPFNLETGLPDKFSSVVTDPIFRYDDRYTDGDGNPICLLVLTLDHEGDAQTIMYPCGPGWVPENKGATAVPEADPNNEEKNFNGNTAVGKLITAMASTEARDEMKRRFDSGVGTRDAAFYDGLGFFWERKSEHVEFEKGGQKIERDVTRLLPTSFEMRQVTGKKKKAPAKKAKANGAVDIPMDEVKAIFDDVPTSEDFIARVKAEVDGWEAWAEQLEDDTSEAGLWYQLVASMG